MLGRTVTGRFKPLTKDLRALDPALVVSALKGWHILSAIKVLEQPDAAKLKGAICMPDDDISRQLAREYGWSNVRYEPVFLRWDRSATQLQQEVTPDVDVPAGPWHTQVMLKARHEGLKSSDIWRQVGAVVVTDGRVVLQDHNQSLPSDHTAWATGDPRSNFSQGESIDASIFLHAEAAVIAKAARRGIPLGGASIFVTDFPCPTCAKLIVASGITLCYYSAGYAVMDGEHTLRAAGVKLGHVPLPPLPGSARNVPYPPRPASSS